MNSKFLVRFVLVWALNSSLFYLGNMLYPDSLVLGTATLSKGMAAVFSGLLLTILCKMAKPFVTKVGIKSVSGRLKMFVFYWLVNSLAIWIIARLAPISGFGIVAFYWAFLLGLATSLGQWLLRQVFKAVKAV